MLDGAARVQDMVRAAAADGQPAIAITDHGVLYGVVDFTKAAMAAGVKPVLGIEAYVTAGSRFDRLPRREDKRYHLTLLAENEAGYRNLIKLASRAYLEGFYYKPRMDLELLAEHSEGIIAASGCLGGHVAQLLGPDEASEEGNVGQIRDYAAAVEVAAMYQDIFGKDNWFIEVQDHGIEGQQRIMDDLIQISRDIGAPLLASTRTPMKPRPTTFCCVSKRVRTRATRIDSGSRVKSSTSRQHVRCTNCSPPTGTRAPRRTRF